MLQKCAFGSLAHCNTGFIAFIAMGIGAWIGWTTTATPPPKPIEMIASEIQKEEMEPNKT